MCKTLADREKEYRAMFEEVVTAFDTLADFAERDKITADKVL